MNVADAVAATLVDEGVEDVFGVIGSGNFLLANALRDAGARFHAARHECGAMMMADGYGRVGDRVAVATTHQGPGFTNALTGLVEAAKARTPALLVTADTPASAQWSNFKIDQAAIAVACGAIAERVHSARSARADAARAIRRARAERLPVVLNVSIDLPALAAGDAPAAAPAPPAGRPGPSPADVDAVVSLIEGSRAPLLLAGRGAVVSPGAREALERLGERSGALLATTAMAHGLFAGLPFALGIAGGFASPLCVELAARADLVISFGAGLNHWTARHGDLLAADAKVVQVDVDPLAPGRLHRCDVAVVADAAIAARAFAAGLGDQAGERRARSAANAAAIAGRRWRDEPFADAGDGERVDPRSLSIALDDLFPPERTLVTDSGHFCGWPPMYLDVPDERGFAFPNAFQSVGLGLGAAIGAAIARPDRLAIAALGDGGTMMALAELETAVRLGLSMAIVVYDDAAYGAEVHHFGPDGHAVDLTRFADADLAATARALGAQGVTVRGLADLAPVGEWLAARAATANGGPIVIDAKVVPTVVAEWLEDAFRSH